MNKTLSKALLTLVFSLTALSAKAEYTFSWLDGLVGYNYTNVNSINNSGQIVGASINLSENTYRATIWNNGVATDINPQGIGSYSIANSINNSGQVVGDSFADGRYSQGTIWNNGVATYLNIDTSKSINNLGQVVGVSGNHAAVWNNGVATTLEMPSDFTSSSATSINDLGQIVGVSMTGFSHTRATVWNNGVATTLEMPSDFTSSSAKSINNLGQIVGYSMTDTRNTRATIWNNGVATTLESMGIGNSVANSINNLGQIVGAGTSEAGGPSATLWDNGVATDLNYFRSYRDWSDGWILIEAWDINDEGSIIGFGYNMESNTARSFLLQSVRPVPEADTSAMLLVGLGMIGFMARRRKNTQA